MHSRYNVEAVEKYHKLTSYLEDKHNLHYTCEELKNQETIDSLLVLVNDPEIKEILESVNPEFGKHNDPVWQYKLSEYYKREDALEAQFAQKGITVEVSGRPSLGTDPYIYKVRLEFTPAQWVDLLNTEGELLPACCAQISAIRDELFTTIRDDSMIRAEDLKGIVLAIHHHDCSEMNECMKYLVNLWEAIKDHADERAPSSFDHNDFDDAIHVIYRSSSDLNCPPFRLPTEQNETKKLHQMYDMAKLFPAFRTVFDFLLNARFPELPCYVVMYGKEILQTIAGPAIYPNKEQAEKTKKHNKNLDDLYVLKGRLSIERGLVLEGDLPH